MAATYTIGSSAKFLSSALNPIRKSSSSQQDRMVRGLPKMKVNTSYPPQIEALRPRVVGYRNFCQSVHFPRVERMKSLKSLQVGWSCVTPVTRITSSAGATHLWGDTKRFASKTSETSKGGPVKSSGGGIGKLDAAHEHGFFHKINKSKLEQMKEMIKKRSAQKKKEEESKKPDPFSSYADDKNERLEIRSGSI